MEPTTVCISRFSIVAAYICVSAIVFTLTDARHVAVFLNFEGPKLHKSSVSEVIKKVKVSRRFDNTAPYGLSLSSPFSLPPFFSLSPIPLPGNSPPVERTPFVPGPPSTALSAPTGYSVSPPPPPPPTGYSLSPPPPPPPTHARNNHFQNPPPSSAGDILSPPMLSPLPSPPFHGPSPPKYVSGPPKSASKPPVAYPPPSAPPPPHNQSQFALWCVAKPTVPDPIIQLAMDYACGSGADCKSIQPNGPCFQPNTLIAHASYAFNSYWQSKKATGGTCDFGGTAMLVTVDPSFEKCHFTYT